MSSTQKNIWLDVPSRDAEVEQVFSHALLLSREKPCSVGVHVAHQLLVTWRAEREHGEEMTLEQHWSCHHELSVCVEIPGRGQAAWGTVCWTQRHAGHGSAWVCVKVGGRGISGPRSLTSFSQLQWGRGVCRDYTPDFIATTLNLYFMPDLSPTAAFLSQCSGSRRSCSHSSAWPSPVPRAVLRFVSPVYSSPACLAIMLVIIWVMKHVLFLSVALINLLSI